MSDDELRLLGSELRRARLAAPVTMTQHAVGQAIGGTSRKTVSAYEAGVIEPPARVLLRLAVVLDLDLNRLARLMRGHAARPTPARPAA